MLRRIAPLRAQVALLGLAWVVSCGGEDSTSAPPVSGADAASDTGVEAAAGSGGSATGGHTGADAAVEADAPTPGLGPPYPIVLCHGFFGFEQFAGAEFATYFYKVREHLASQGEPLVFTPAVDPFNDSSVRGAQLIARIEQIRMATGYAKVNLIGHSQGGLDVRVVAHERPDLVASVTTIATPHGGTPVADLVLKLVQSPALQDVVDALVKLVGAPLYDAVGEDTSVMAPLKLFSKPGITAFNAKYTDSPSVEYYSITGRTGYHLGGSHCNVANAPSFVSKYKLVTDATDALLVATETYLDGGLTDPYPNDGLVRVQDAKWGTFLGCLPADHLDEVGHLFGDKPGLTNSFDHLEFYASLVAFLRQKAF